MSRKVFDAAMKLVREYSEMIAIGGGEPTLHPKFWEFVGLALVNRQEDCGVWLATNGSQTEIALRLSWLARDGLFGVALSRDDYHDPIDQKVIAAFESVRHPTYPDRRNEQDLREWRDVSGREMKAGRCDFGEDRCVCPEMFVTPTGRIRGCGCKKAADWGTVWEPKIPDDRESGECTARIVKKIDESVQLVEVEA